MYYLISAIIGFLFGSIPTGYFILKLNNGIDIRKSGSGNVGAFNSMIASKSKLTGILVLLIDFAKGFLAVFVIKLLFSDIFIYPAVALFFAVMSHNYNPFLKFKGGRGLATAAGGCFMLFPYVLFCWLILWSISFLLKKKIIIANTFATILSILLVFATVNIAIKYTYPLVSSNMELLIFNTSILLLILTKHISAFLDAIKNEKRNP